MGDGENFWERQASSNHCAECDNLLNCPECGITLWPNDGLEDLIVRDGVQWGRLTLEVNKWIISLSFDSVRKGFYVHTYEPERRIAKELRARCATFPEALSIFLKQVNEKKGERHGAC